MDGSACAILVPEGDGYELYVKSHGCEKSYVETKQCTLGDKKEAAIVVSRALDVPRISDNDIVADPVIRVPADGSAHNLESCEHISLPDLSCEQKDAGIFNDVNLCERFCQSLSFGPKIQRNFSKSATFPSSIETCPDLPTAHPSATEVSTYARSISLPASLKIVSAMKGGRAQNGSLPEMELHVKWAPEVYDPPCTSMSHTVNGHRPRPKAKKKDNRKKNKGKSARGSGGSEKKNASHKYSTNAGSHVNGRKVLLDGYDKSQVLEYSVGVQEANCATSFLREVLPKVHLPVGEAS